MTTEELARAKRKDQLTDAQLHQVNAGETPACPECGSPMRLRRSRFGLFYGCPRYPACQGTHGAHPNGVPLGVPANTEVKRLRMRAHELLEARFGRKRYFAFLKKTLGISTEDAHVGKLQKPQLDIVIATLEGNWDTRA